MSINTGYTISYMHGCRIVTGSVPLNDMEMLTHGFSKKAVMSPHIADKIGAAFVIGELENIKKMEASELPLSSKRTAEKQAALKNNLPDKVLNWIVNGERGNSSNTICQAIYGIPDPQERVYTEYPFDIADLRRCMLFLETLDYDGKQLFEKVADLSPEWNRLYKSWNEISDCYYFETDNHYGYAPKTHDLMKKVISGK